MYRLSVVIALMLVAAVQADDLPLPRKLDNAGPTVPPPLFQPALEDGGHALSNVRNDVRQVQRPAKPSRPKPRRPPRLGTHPSQLKPTKSLN